ncbi:hypothetical protein Hypma_015604 [Hypsizygus marmoreus]|uniref:Nucleoporin n=1 Tax=Hypsizygus marmoreus TaxID=39966 RepID=A0A369K3L0_HYPMA|nr:hypothetical protein Hypma_015604 [Hypsizygus marmoreus]
MASATAFPPAHSFGGPNNGGGNSKPVPRPVQVPPIDLPALQNASKVLQDWFAKDASIIPDLGDLLTSPSGQVSASYSVFPDDLRVPYQKRKFIGIPDGLFQFYDTASVISHMGLMPEIERAWISIDHKLFLWDYIDGHEISSFVDQPDVITEVALVRPKKGLFIDEISHLLVICTPITVLLIGVSFSSPSGRGRAFQQIKLYATDLALSTDVEMTSVIGTQDGRIFMCGAQDGSLYEFHYQENESWFGKRVQLINHSVGGVQSLLPRFASSSAEERIILLVSDLARNCFYTLTSKGSISVYKLTGDKAVQHAQTLSNLFKAAQDRAPGYPALTPKNFQIISLHVVEPTESRSGIQLFAITSSGVRLYFGPSTLSTYPYGPSLGGGTSTRPLQLIHVRLPPSNLLHPDAHLNPYRPPVAAYGTSQTQSQPPPRPYTISSIENTCYAKGLTVAAQQGDVDGTDYILCLAPDLTRIGTLGQLNLPQQQPPSSGPSVTYRTSLGDGRPPLTEYATLLAIPGRTWAMASVPRASPSFASDPSAPAVINELATQFGEPPYQFMLLTNVGLTFLAKRRALDYLKAVLEDLQSEGNVQPIIDFRDSFGRDQTCAMLLGLASGNTFLDNSDISPSGTIGMLNPDIAAVAKQAFYDFGERPMWAERVTYGTTDSQGTAIFSGRREGLCLYFARLVRPIWKAKLTKPAILGRQKLTVSEDTLVTVQKNLFALKDFLDKNPHLFHSSPSESTTRVPDQEAWKAEQNSIAQLLVLLSRTIEALSFVLLLSDYMLGDLISQCDAETQKLIATQTFEDLVTTHAGMNISRALVNVIIDQQIGQQISVDAISDILQSRCGSFCSTDDVMLYKAKENVRKALEAENPVDRQNRLAESLRLFIKGARILEFEKLQEICGDYQQLGYAKGCVELPLACAHVSDPDNVGLEAWNAGLNPTDPRTPYARYRLQCYELVMDALSTFEAQSHEAKAAAPVNSPYKTDPEAVRNHAYELSFASEDEIFHSTLYDWLIARGLSDDLLAMRPAFLEAHLKREPVTVQKFQLLWQFYVKNGQPLRAAEVLGALAESDQFDLGLDSRLEYLTLAVANAKSHPISATGRHETAIAFLTDLEEKLDVAQVQLEMYNILLPHLNDAVEVGDRIRLLSTRLFTMTELYQLYAIPFDLADMKLLCLHVSEHRDESVVRPIWNQIFDDILKANLDPNTTADHILTRVVALGKRFFPSDSAFPLRYIATLLVRFTLANKEAVPPGWAPRILIQSGVPYTDVWDVFHEMYESQVPPFNDQGNVQSISSDIAVLLSDWLEEAKRPQSSVGRGEFPVGRIDHAVDQYLAELEAGRTETKALYESIKRQLRRNW